MLSDNFVPVFSSNTKEENINQIRQRIFALKTFTEKIERSISQLDAKSKEWSQLMSSLSGVSLQAEEAHFDKTAQGPDGFIELDLTANDVLADLTVSIQELELTLSTYEANSIASGSGTSPSRRDQLTSWQSLSHQGYRGLQGTSTSPLTFLWRI